MLLGRLSAALGSLGNKGGQHHGSEVGLHVFGKEAMGMRVGRKKKLAAVKAHGMEKPIDLV